MLFNAVYQAVVEEGRKGETWFLDLGCCMGTDVRKLVLDGYRASNVCGCDIRSEFMDLGENKERGLFRDADRTEITFFEDDILNLSLTRSNVTSITKSTLHEFVSGTIGPEANFGLESLKGRMTHVSAGALFHLFDEETQYAMALRVALLLKLKRADESASSCVIFGCHQGKEQAGSRPAHKWFVWSVTIN